MSGETRGLTTQKCILGRRCPMTDRYLEPRIMDIMVVHSYVKKEQERLPNESLKNILLKMMKKASL